MSKFLPEGMVLGTFQPHAAEFTDMDNIVVMTVDVSMVTKWHGLVCIQHMVDGDILKGFTLIGAEHLRGKRQTKFVPMLLLRAFSFDKKSKQHSSSWKELLELYLPAARLLSKHPTTWQLS